MISNNDIMNLIMSVAAKIKRQPPRPPSAQESLGIPSPSSPPPRFGMGRLLERLLSHGGSMTPTELADDLNIRLPSLSETIKKLEAKGCVRREPSSSHGRSHHLSLTDAGKEQAERYKMESERFTADFFKPITTAEKEQLAAILTKLLEGAYDR